MLEGVGISELEERLYQALLERPGASLSELAAASQVTRQQVRKLLEALEDKGLVSRSPTTPPRWVPAPPDVAVEVLILQRHEELERARLGAAKLVDKYRGGVETTSPIELVEVVTGREAIAQRFMQLATTTKGELLGFDKPPYVGRLETEQPMESGLLERGVVCRGIYDRESLDVPGRLEVVRELVAAGEQARVLADVPLKLFIADRRLGMIPLRLEEPGLDGALMVHRSPLLHALTVLFETLWERAAPIRFVGREWKDVEERAEV